MSAPTSPSPAVTEPAPAAAKRRRWILLGLAGLFLLFALFSAIDPFGDKGYVEISHGDHVHYLPEDNLLGDPNSDVTISNFPGTPPGPDERILPDGRVVPR